MSSFVISKKSYITAAGYMAGIQSFYRDFFVFDHHGRRKVQTAEQWYNLFFECYKMNALSVAEQYGDESPEDDPNEYRDAFKAGKAAAVNDIIRNKKAEGFHKMKNFLNSAMYQTEKESYFWKMKIFFSDILLEFVKYAYPSKSESWGEFTVDESSESPAPLF